MIENDSAEQQEILIHSIQASNTTEEIQASIQLFLEFAKGAGAVDVTVPAAVCHEIAEKLFDDFEATGRIMVPYECASFFELAGVRFMGDARWKAIVDTEAEELSAEAQKSGPWLNRLLGQVSLTGLVRGVDRGLVRLINLFSEYPGIMPQISNDVGHLLAEAGWFDSRLPKTRKHIAKMVLQCLRKGEAINDLPGLFSALGFNKISPTKWLEFLFSNVLLKTINEAGKMGRFDLALRLELMTYLSYLGKFDSRDHYHKVMSRLLPAMRKVGHAHLQRLETFESKTESLENVPLVVFYLHSSDIMGHTEVFLTLLRAVANSIKKRFRPLVYVEGGSNPELTDRLEAYNVPYVFVTELAGNNSFLTQRWEAIRNDCKVRGVEIFIFVSAVLYMAYAYALRVAPVQIWWSMKYHCLSLPEIDGYLTLGSFQKFKEIEGRSWGICHRALEALYDPSLEPEAIIIRAQLRETDETIILGCLGREEKLLNEPFAHSLAQILKKVPEAIFIWTGKIENSDVTRLFKAHGVEDQCLYVGWVNTRLYAQVLDVFVDSYPFASGLTAFETMAAGHPVVALVTPEALGIGFPNHLWPAYSGAEGIDANIHKDVRDIFTGSNGGSVFSTVETESEYVDMAVRLAKEKDFREEAGLAAKTFIERYMHDEAAMAETFSDYILEIYAPKAATA
ncbi:MAG: hypothetical protein VCA36_03480 [Opitutales bacterium]